VKNKHLIVLRLSRISTSSLKNTTLMCIDDAIGAADIYLILVDHKQFLTLANQFKPRRKVSQLDQQLTSG